MRFVVGWLVCLCVMLSCSSKSDGGDLTTYFLDLDVGESRTVVVSMHCGFEYLEIEVNGQTWATTPTRYTTEGDPIDPVLDSDDSKLRLHLVEPDLLTATAPSTNATRTYQPAPTPWPVCF